MNERTGQQRRSLLGLHDEDNLGVYSARFRRHGYVVDGVGTPEEMIERMQAGQYDWYLIDANFGQPRAKDVAIACQAYGLVQDRW